MDRSAKFCTSEPKCDQPCLNGTLIRAIHETRIESHTFLFLFQEFAAAAIVADATQATNTTNSIHSSASLIAQVDVPMEYVLGQDFVSAMLAS